MTLSLGRPSGGSRSRTLVRMRRGETPSSGIGTAIGLEASGLPLLAEGSLFKSHYSVSLLCSGVVSARPQTSAGNAVLLEPALGRHGVGRFLIRHLSRKVVERMFGVN